MTQNQIAALNAITRLRELDSLNQFRRRQILDSDIITRDRQNELTQYKIETNQTLASVERGNPFTYIGKIVEPITSVLKPAAQVIKAGFSPIPSGGK